MAFFWRNHQMFNEQLVSTDYPYGIDRMEKENQKLLLLSVFCISLFLAHLHVLPVLFDRHRLDFLIYEHKVNAFQFHHDLDIV